MDFGPLIWWSHRAQAFPYIFLSFRISAGFGHTMRTVSFLVVLFWPLCLDGTRKCKWRSPSLHYDGSSGIGTSIKIHNTKHTCVTWVLWKVMFLINSAESMKGCTTHIRGKRPLNKVKVRPIAGVLKNSHVLVNMNIWHCDPAAKARIQQPEKLS